MRILPHYGIHYVAIRHCLECTRVFALCWNKQVLRSNQVVELAAKAAGIAQEHWENELSYVINAERYNAVLHMSTDRSDRFQDHDPDSITAQLWNSKGRILFAIGWASRKYSYKNFISRNKTFAHYCQLFLMYIVFIEYYTCIKEYIYKL